MRREALTASHMSIFTCHSHIASPISATNHNFDLFHVTRKLTQKLFSKRAIYKKAGVMFCDLRLEKCTDQDLFLDQKKWNQKRRLSRTIDNINQRYSNRAIFLASQGIKQNWQPLCQKKSRAYTTSFNHLLEVS